MSKIKNIKAHEIADSKGNPTVEVQLETSKGSFTASVPSGKSTGKHEALELRDIDGKGVLIAIKNVNNIIAKKLKGLDVTDQSKLDELMIRLDGTENKSALGSNAILPVSIAILKAGAADKKVPLYQYISEISNLLYPQGLPAGASQILNLKMPLPMFNILEGGAHVPMTRSSKILDGETVGTDNHLDFQEFMVVPQKKSFSENLILANKIFNNLKEILIKNYGQDLKMGDEGGFAPHISKTEQALFSLKNAIGSDYAKIALDIAASEFYKEGKYFLEGNEFSRTSFLDFYKDIVNRFDVILIEDPFSEDDWQGFEEITRELKNTIIVGDDLTATNVKRIKESKAKNACNGIIIKPNQTGTITEAIKACKLAKSYGWKIIVSHRSRETMEDFISDFAVGVGADFVKFGSPIQEERMVKYGRLLKIEKELHS